MGWFNRKSKKVSEEELDEKLNPAQELIARGQGETAFSRENTFNYRTQYETIEIVHRGVNMVVDDAADLGIVVGEALSGVTPVYPGVRKKTLYRLLNYEPNPFQDISTFKRNLTIDLIIDGNCFIYFDGAFLYHLPADKVTIHSDTKTYISHYEFEGKINYYPNEIIHVKENSFFSIYRGISRLRPATRSMKILSEMKKFQDNFFVNGTVPGLVIKTPNTLSEKIKERLLASWRLKYRPSTGGRNPMILDGGMELSTINQNNFKDLDFQNSILEAEKTILKAIGVPPVLLDGGNQANIRPNHRLFYLETIIPIVRKMNKSISRFFGYELWEDDTETPALQPELSEHASYLGTLVNTGIITVNEARFALGKEKIDGNDILRIPANIAGSAGNPSEGGRPPEEDED